MTDSVDKRARSRDEDVRDELAWDTTSAATMMVLARDTTERVRTDLANNPNLSSDVIEWFVGHSEDPLNVGAIVNCAVHSNASADQLRRMVALKLKNPESWWSDLSAHDNVLMNVAANPNTPMDILQTLTSHKHKEIAQFARETLSGRMQG
jgi:hypothetical protein